MLRMQMKPKPNLNGIWIWVWIRIQARIRIRIQVPIRAETRLKAQTNVRKKESGGGGRGAKKVETFNLICSILMDFNETQTGEDAAGAVWMTDWLQPAELLAKGHSSRAAKTLTNAKAREIHFAIAIAIAACASFFIFPAFFW